MTRSWFTGPLLSLALLIAPAAHASSLTGDVLNGSISYIHPGLTLSNQFSSPATVGSGVEFNGSVFLFENYDISADFSSNALVLSVVGPLYSGIETGNSLPLITLTFSGFPSGFAGFSSPTYSNNAAFAPGGNTFRSDSYSGSTFIVNLNGLGNGDTYTFDALPTPSPTPEPGSITLVLTGLAGAAEMFRRRAVSL